MATTKGDLGEVARNAGDDPDTLVCFYQPVVGDYPGWTSEQGDLIRCAFSELPEREFDPGYGAPEGERCIAFSDCFVYVKIQYDGSEWFEPIPRHPEIVTAPIPWPGG